MTRRFNLLPASYVERMAERRLAAMTAAGLVMVLAVLALLGFGQSRALRQAESRRDVEQARTDVLVARRGQLVRFRQLADGIAARERLLTAAMGTEVSWAAILTSLARSFPADAALTSVSLEMKLPPFGAPLPTLGDKGTVIGSTALHGYSMRTFSPGVERLLRVLVGVTGLSEPRLQEGTRTEIGSRPVTTFEGTAFIDAAALTGRYGRGLPPEDDVELPAVAGGGSSSGTGSVSGSGAPK